VLGPALEPDVRVYVGVVGVPPHMAYFGPQVGLQDFAYDDGEV
jgi:hypothetical protein